MQSSGRQFQRDDTRAFATFDQYVHEMELVEEGNIVLYTLLVQCLEDHVPGAVGGVTRPAHGRLAEIPGVTAEPALVDFSFRRPAEGQTPVLKVVHCPYRIFGQDSAGLLIDQIVAALDSIECVPLELILLNITERSADPPLCRAGMTADRKQL
jgi:hypothetical protein